MATSPVPQWAREQSPYHRGPTGAGVLFLALVVVLAVLLLQLAPTTDRGGQEPGSFCDQHRGRPAWDSICAEARHR
jgi:hypothetical protein